MQRIKFPKYIYITEKNDWEVMSNQEWSTNKFYLITQWLLRALEPMIAVTNQLAGL